MGTEAASVTPERSGMGGGLSGLFVRSEPAIVKRYFDVKAQPPRYAHVQSIAQLHGAFPFAGSFLSMGLIGMAQSCSGHSSKLKTRSKTEQPRQQPRFRKGEF